MMISIFFSYCHADEQHRDNLEKHLSVLKRQGFIDTWHDRRIAAGKNIDSEISEALENAAVILLLVSPDFLASDYCYDVEMKRAIAKHESGDSQVIPVILRPCDWHDAPFGKLMATPKDGKAITLWPNLDEAFLDIVKSIKTSLPSSAKSAPSPIKEDTPDAHPSIALLPRSSNLRVRKFFTDADKDSFLDNAFDFTQKFFEGSLAEFQERNQGFSTKFRRIDANKFTAIIYKDGASVSECKIILGGMFGKGITYSSSAQASDGSCNESLSVECDDQLMFIRPMGMAKYGGREQKLSFEGAAEYLWDILITRLQ